MEAPFLRKPPKYVKSQIYIHKTRCNTNNANCETHLQYADLRAELGATTLGFAAGLDFGKPREEDNGEADVFTTAAAADGVARTNGSFGSKTDGSASFFDFPLRVTLEAKHERATFRNKEVQHGENFAKRVAITKDMFLFI